MTHRLNVSVVRWVGGRDGQVWRLWLRLMGLMGAAPCGENRPLGTGQQTDNSHCVGLIDKTRGWQVYDIFNIMLTYDDQ